MGVLRVRAGVGWSAHRVVASVAIAALVLAGCCDLVGAKGSGGNVKVGDVECPCFCSERLSFDWSPFWTDTFGALDESAGVRCASECVDPASVLDFEERLPLCGKYVDYRFCPRFMNYTSAAEYDLDSVAHRWSYLRFLDDMASACTNDLPEQQEFQGATTCRLTIEKGACYVAFPKCHPDTDEPVGVCRSHCSNERRQCRSDGSMFGPSNVIDETCAGGDYVDEVGPSDLCTGSSNALRPSIVVALLVLGVPLLREMQE